MTPDSAGGLTDVPGVLVGHAQRVGDGWASGVTVVLPPPGTVGGVDVRGGGPGTHETDALAPGTLVDTVDAVVLTGGSAYGLAAVAGVVRWCEEHGRGFDVSEAVGSPARVPIVPAAALFDLGRGGDWRRRPDPDLGHAAAAAATATTSAAAQRGSVGAGTGALVARGTVKGGVGGASVRLPGGVTVAALVVANAVGWLVGEELPRSTATTPPLTTTPPLNTTLVVVATDAPFDVATTTRTATAAHDGLARALTPVHTLMDGDTVLALATGGLEVPVDVVLRATVQAAAADVVEAAARDAVRSATRVPGVDVPPWSELRG